MDGTEETTGSTIPDRYAVGDRLDWEAAWVDVSVCVELPFWLFFDNIVVALPYNEHQFSVAVHDNYWELSFGQTTDSRRSVIHRGPFKRDEELSSALREIIARNPRIERTWRKCKSYLKIQTRCNEDAWVAAGEEEGPRQREGLLYLSELSRAHIPVVNALVIAYRLATYDYFAFQVTPWDVPHWSIVRNGESHSCDLFAYKGWDYKPLNFGKWKGSDSPTVHKLIEGSDLQTKVLDAPAAGELELINALNLMERGDYSGAVRRVTTSIEVLLEELCRQAMESTEGATAAEKFLRKTRTRFDIRLKTYQELTKRNMSPTFITCLKDIRNLRHEVVHGGLRIDTNSKGQAQKAVDTGRWIFNWLEDKEARRSVREGRIALRSLGRDITSGVFEPRITSDGVVLSRSWNEEQETQS